MTVTDSILDDTKKVLNIPSESPVFDQDIILHVNSVFSTLKQLGVGPDDGFMISDNTATWASYIEGKNGLNMVKTYIYLRVRLIFDPPSTGFVTDSFKSQISELEWRLMTEADTFTYPSDGGGTIVTPEDVATAVQAYLAANPVADGVTFAQSIPLSTWTFAHQLHRIPVVSVYVDGEEVEADVTATDTTVTIEFPAPTAGFAVLT